MRYVNLRRKNTSAVVKPLIQRKKWKHTKKKCTRNLVASSLTDLTSNVNNLLSFYSRYHFTTFYGLHKIAVVNFERIFCTITFYIFHIQILVNAFI